MQQRRALQLDQTNKIAFSAYLSRVPSELGYDQIIPFDLTFINTGGAFDPQSHMFTCPVTGVYFFYSTVSSNPHDHIETEIVVNGYAHAVSYAAGSTMSDQGSSFLVEQCNQGENVWVKKRNDQGTTMMGGSWTTFGGFLLFDV